MSGQQMFRPAKPRRAFDEIIAQIRDLIQRGELKPGDRLPSERVLAEQFAVSRNTVREALRMLEISGLITLKKGATGGAFISRADSSVVARSLSDTLYLTDFSLADVTEARLWIESIVVRVACERMTEEQLAALDDNVKVAAKLTDEQDWERKALVHLDFHNLLADATGNPLMSIMMRSLMEMMREIVLSVGPTQSDFMLRSRRRLLTKFRQRDADGAVQEMERYLRRLHKLWLSGSYPGSRTAGAATPSA
ncbi:FadR family transcriptional regulator [Actinomadura darangshiensis]|uniref:FadR family transcriptional regulator n=1 Tax=Actinomadura darangshiensis TaxID=705336 RepID=A0A4R5BME9_9ACTN|nr:FadR/GntR family transcriptional regulator [Actinomadura darangshiensis]TDD87978.1 FadR family transcriptional regulator [Actinomadura darangshiensis]